MAIIEGWATCLLCYLSGAGASGLTVAAPSPFAATLYGSLLNYVSLTLFIFAAAPASGGHLNPAITLATFFAGLSTLPRTILYVVAQSAGAIIGSYWLRLSLGVAYFPLVKYPAGSW